MSQATFISTYPPRTCGLATFTRHLRESLLRKDTWKANVLAMDSSAPEEEYPEEVTFRIRENAVEDYAEAAERINAGASDLVSVQHEFGIFGGPEGLYLTELLARIDKPVVTTLHTVLPEPSLPYQRALQAVARLSDGLVVMTETARGLLSDVYGVRPEKISTIPHGVPDLPFHEPSAQKGALDLAGRTVLLTFGLLGPGKGIEFVLDALPTLVRDHPEVLYVVLGTTHPEVRRRSGESYREHLRQRVEALGLEAHVRFINQYVTQEDLLRYLQACDIYVTPYPGRDQVSSGTLAYALGAGAAIVSTPYLYAEEVLADDVGRLVPYGDTETLERTLRVLVVDDEVRATLRERAHAVGQSMTWSSVGDRYARLFSEVLTTGRSIETRSMRPAIPRFSLNHLVNLTDQTGIFQHAPYGVPERRHGYCTDDVARALVVLTRFGLDTGGASTLPLIRTYLSFLQHAQGDDGTFRNFLSYDRRFVDETPSEDTTGRALWGLGAAAAGAPDPALRQLAREMLERARDASLHHPHALAYAICGLALFLRRYDSATQTRRSLTQYADQLVAHYRAARRPDWPWFHDAITYGNAILPLALLEAYRTTGRRDFRTIGLDTLDFLLKTTYHEDRFFDFIGNQGWYTPGEPPPRFAQQSIEAGYTAEACTVAHEMTGETRYRTLARAAVDWFSGRNRLGDCLYNPATGACADGLELYGASFNQGAESTIACLLGLLAIHTSSQQARGWRPSPRALDARPSPSTKTTTADHGPVRT